MIDWKIFAVLTPLFFASFQSLSKLLPKTTSPLLVGAYTSLAAFCTLLILHILLSENKSFSLGSTKSILIVVVIGILIGLGNFGIFKAFSLGAPQSIFTLITYVLLIVFGILFGTLFWHEKMSLPQIFGALISIAGILIIIYYRK
ncbi:MAG TPA: EamA family transporter [Candidatus Limnocylindrales bacterium]|nr:EamA family transporter [Candidatus Limnocylindrales bacterium]